MLDNIFTHILDMSATASLVIGVVLAARLCMKRLPKIFSYCLWAVVLLRLLCPVSIPVPVGGIPQVSTVTQDYSLADKEISMVNAGSAALSAIGDAANGGLGIQHIYLSEPTIGDEIPTTTCYWWECWVLFGQYVWAAGFIGLAAVSLVRLLRLKRQLAEAVKLRHNIYICDGIPTPFVMGLLRPKIYLPSGISQEEMAYIIRHEQHHISRLDPLWKALSFIALCLHWFNPLVWLAFLLANQDMEMSCDEAVLRKMGTEIRADYAQSLLRLSTGRTTIVGAPLAFGEGDAGLRIRNLSKWKQPARWAAILAGILCVALIFGCAAGKNPAERTNPAESTPPPIKPGEVADVSASMVYDWSAEDSEITLPYVFRLDEYPGVVFTLVGGNLVANEFGISRSLYSGMPIQSLYLADLNGDGKRELCSCASFGSGLVSEHILVFDYADDMLYCLAERGEFDYSLQLDDGKLSAIRVGHYAKGPIYLGKLVLSNRVLSFVSDQITLSALHSSPVFSEKTLEYTISTYRNWMDRSMIETVRLNEAIEYYMAQPKTNLGQISHRDNNLFDIHLSQGAGEADDRLYLMVLDHYTDVYSDYAYYIYRDPEDPARLLICTELRDTGYRTAADYFQALIAGKCQAHPETFIIRLDENAIYRWGESENLW